ncbi:MAG: hypothetical protein H6742_11265 [Alphaproteobacteria bacterium]|nr:hypothetical protein [Alphaproteobacteria bacterium]
MSESTRSPKSALFALLGAGALLGASLPAAAQDHPAGQTIDNAVGIDVTQAGFDAILALVPSLLPSGIEVPELADEYEGALGQCWLGGYAYSVYDGWVTLSIADAALVPNSGYLTLDADLRIEVNDASVPMQLYTELECIGDTCDVWVDPFTANINTTLALAVDERTGLLDAQIGTINLDYSDLTSGKIHLENCWIGTVEDILNFFGLSLFDIVLGLVGGELEGAVADFGPQIEVLIEDAFNTLVLEDTIDLAGVQASYGIVPGDVQIEPAGVRILMDGYMDVAEPAPCIAAYDTGSSYGTDGALPAIGSVPTGVTPGYAASALISDDFGNQALYALWRGGLLCYTLQPGDDTLPIPLDTTLLGLLAGDAFDDLFPESKPISIVTRPKNPPLLAFDSESDIGIVVDDLGLEVYGELDHRMALVVGVDLDAEAGINLALDGTTGDLAIELALAGEDLVPTVTDNEFAPGKDADIEASFSGGVGSLIEPIIGGLAGDLAFALPAFEGIGLTTLEFAPTGPGGDWLGGYAGLGAVPYGGDAAACGTGGGCDMGCASGSRAPGSGWLVLGIPLALIGLRRRGR